MPREGTRTRTHRCPDNHRHAGTITCYRSHGCGCEPCTERNRTQGARERRRAAYGQTVPLHDAAEAQILVAGLRETMTLRAIARSCGVPQATIQRIYHHRSARVTVRLLDALKAVTDPVLLDASLVDATGTVRRLQALAYMGWSFPALSARCGMSKEYLRKLMQKTVCRVSTVRTITALYDELWATPPVAQSPHERATVAKTRGYARAHQWVGPLAWDNIDDPTETPDTEITADRPGWALTELEHLHALGESAAVALAAFPQKPETLEQQALRHHRNDIAAWIRTARKAA